MIITLKYNNTVVYSMSLASLYLVLKQKFMYTFNISWVGEMYNKHDGTSFYFMK